MVSQEVNLETYYFACRSGIWAAALHNDWRPIKVRASVGVESSAEINDTKSQCVGNHDNSRWPAK